MGRVSTTIRAFVTTGEPVECCGCLSCDACYPSERDVEAALRPVAPDAKPAPKAQPVARAVPTVSPDDVFGGQLWTY